MSDFDLAIKATQTAGHAFVEHRKVPLAKRADLVDNFLQAFQKAEGELTQKLVDGLGYPPVEAQWGLTQSRHLLVQLQERLKVFPEQIPLGPCLIYGTWSSPALRFCQTVMAALALGNSVLLWTTPAAAPLYRQLGQLLQNAGWPEALYTVIATDDKDAQETLLSHPALRAVHFAGHYYEGALARNISWTPNKKNKVFFGGHNPVIWTHDASLVNLRQYIEDAFRYHRRGEERFNRWFVQEKNYPQFIEAFKDIFQALNPKDFGSPPDTTYRDLYNKQMRDLGKERNWLTTPNNPLADETTLNLQVSLDFNNCSAWQQSEVLGPVITVTRYKNSQEAIKFCNTTQFASAASIMASTREKAAEIATQLQMPKVYINTLPTTFTDEATRASYESGIGNETSDFHFFSHPKTIS